MNVNELVEASRVFLVTLTGLHRQRWYEYDSGRVPKEETLENLAVILKMSPEEVRIGMKERRKNWQKKKLKSCQNMIRA